LPIEYFGRLDAIWQADAVVLLSGGVDVWLGEAIQLNKPGAASRLLIAGKGIIVEGCGLRASVLL